MISHKMITLGAKPRKKGAGEKTSSLRPRLQPFKPDNVAHRTIKSTFAELLGSFEVGYVILVLKARAMLLYMRLTIAWDCW